MYLEYGSFASAAKAELLHSQKCYFLSLGVWWSGKTAKLIGDEIVILTDAFDIFNELRRGAYKTWGRAPKRAKNLTNWHEKPVENG